MIGYNRGKLPSSNQAAPVAMVDNDTEAALLSKPSKDEACKEEAPKSISAKHVALVVVVALTSVTQGTATKGWTAVLPKMQNDTQTFTVTDDDVAWLELSPSRIRGAMTAMSEVCGSIGLLIGYLMAYLFTWQVATALCSLTAGLLLLPTMLVPESPYWLVRRGRTEAARGSLQRLMGSKAAAEDELSAISSMPAARQASRTQQFTELAKGRNARPVLLVLSFFVLRELGGRSCIMMYTVYIFREAGVQLDAFTCTVLVGVARTLCTCLTAAVLDKTGRRPMLMGTAVVGGVAQGACGLFLYLQVPGASWVPLAAVLVYVAAYGTGIGPIPWVYVGELVPSPVRSLGASLITACDAVVVFSINLGFLRLIAHIGLGVTFIIFGVLNFLIGVIVWLLVPETKGVHLQELELAFSRPEEAAEESEEQSMLAAAPAEACMKVNTGTQDC